VIEPRTAQEQFTPTESGVFRELRGPAFVPGPPPSQWKLCLTATDEDYLAKTLLKIAKRSDCFYVKYSTATSPKSRDGMMLGRVFMASDDACGVLWAELYGDRKLMVSVQNDVATEPYRGAAPPSRGSLPG
jgi:hypothetical protein